MAASMMAAIAVVPAYAAESVDYSDKLTELKSLMDQCKDQGIPTDYEQVSYATIERFEDYINQDLEKGIDSSYTNYEKACVDAIYSEAKSNLQAYIAGTKDAKSVVRPDMQNLTVNGDNIYYGKSPVFSIGYGFFGMAQADIPNFQSFGANNIQMEIGPHQTWKKGSNGWNIYLGTQGINASANIVNTEKHSGSNSLNMVFNDTAGANRYVAAERSIPCKPNTTYTLGCWAKGTTTDWNAWMTFDWVSSGRVDFLSPADWTKYERTYTTGADQTSMNVLVLVENTADLYIDDMYVYEEGSDKNLLSNAGFEADVYPEVESLKVHLANAQNNNVAVSLLLAPHYLENIAAENGIPLTSDDQATFIRFDINNAKVKEIIEAHIRGVLSNVKDYTCIDSICISNEPWFDTRWFSDYTDDFKAYAIAKHGSEENARNVYGLYSWQDITMPETNFFGNYKINARAYDWMEFNDKVFTDWHKWMEGIVREYLPDTPVHSKVMENVITSGETKERVELARGTDYELFGEFSDYSGIDGSNYSDDEYYEMMFHYDYLESVVDKPVYNSETHIIKDYSGDAAKLDAFSNDTTKKALTKMWQGAVHGRDLSTVWAWQRHYADDQNNSAFFGGLLFRPDLVEGLGQMNLDFARLADEIVELQENSDKVALFYSKPSRLYNSAHITNVLSVYKELVKNGYDVGVVTEKSVDKLSGYKTLIIPSATHTTQAALTAIEGFITNGGKVLYSGNDVLSKNEYEKSLSNSNVINAGSTYSLSAIPAGAVTLKDASTGAAVTGIEWQYSLTEDRILVNAVNMTDSAKVVDVYYNGEKLTKMKELITDNAGIGSVTLSSYEPQLLEYNLNTSDAEDMQDLTFDAVRKTISWKDSGNNIDSVTVYKYNADNTVSYAGKTAVDNFVYDQDGTYILYPVLNDGTALAAKVITTIEPEDLINLKFVSAKTKYISAAVENKTEHYIRVKLVAEALNASGTVLGYGYSNTIISPEDSREIGVSLSCKGTPYSLRIRAYDDAGNLLGETISKN